MKENCFRLFWFQKKCEVKKKEKKKRKKKWGYVKIWGKENNKKI